MLNTSTGAVMGTPTASGTFTVKVTDAVGNSSTSCMITINGPLSVTCSAVNTGDVGVPFNSGPMTVTGGHSAVHVLDRRHLAGGADAEHLRRAR